MVNEVTSDTTKRAMLFQLASGNLLSMVLRIKEAKRPKAEQITSSTKIISIHQRLSK